MSGAETRWQNVRRIGMKRVAVYAGSFDPITNGHAWVVEQAARMFDLVIVAVGRNSSKKNFYSQEERIQMVHDYACSLHSTPELRDKVSLGDREWWVNGERHRDNNLPAVVNSRGGQYTWMENLFANPIRS